MRRIDVCAVVVAFLLSGPMEGLQARSTTEMAAELAARGWLLADADPLGAAIASTIDRVEPIVGDAGEAICYVVHLHPSGFIILSSDDRIEPILAFSASGAYDPSPRNPLGALIRNDMRSRMEVARGDDAGLPAGGRLHVSAGPDLESAAQRKWQTLWDTAASRGDGIHILGLEAHEIDDPRVDPLLEIEGIRWSQKNLLCGAACYNYYTPGVKDGLIRWNPGSTDSYPCGCVATALAQLMRFHRHPEAPIVLQEATAYVVTDTAKETKESFTKLLLGGTGPAGRYEWDLMDPRPDCVSKNEAQRREIGALCFDAGLAAGATYGPEETLANMDKAANALVDVFQYRSAVSVWCNDCNYVAGLTAMVNSNLDAAKPVLLGIKRFEAGAVRGHAIVCDGYGYHLATMYHHLNLGWDRNDRAAHDVWYNLPDVNSPSREYTAVRECVYNVFPDAVGEIISGRVYDGHGRPAAGVTVRAESDDGMHRCADTTDARGIYALIGCRSDTGYLARVEGLDAAQAPGPSYRRYVRTGTSRDRCATCGNRWGVDFPLTAGQEGPLILRVDSRAAGAGDGASWTSAFPELRDAIAHAVARRDGARGVEIWVAAGTYKPAVADRKQSFLLLDDVGIYGGFAAWETRKDQRHPLVHETILSGDLAGNDARNVTEPGDASRSDNSVHVVYSCGNSGTAILDGFLITGGNACGDDPNALEMDDIGAGMYIRGGRPTISNCRFDRNAAAKRAAGVYCVEGASPVFRGCTWQANASENGTALYSYESSPALYACTFEDNRGSYGGAVYLYRGGASLVDCNFAGNEAETSGGAIYVGQKTSASIAGCNFLDNKGLHGWGGAVYSSTESEPNFTGCTFVGNQALEHSGGALYNNDRSAPLLWDCQFTSNEAKWGGAIYNDANSTSQFVLCTFTGNQASESSGGAMYNGDGSSASIRDCNFTSNGARWGGAVYCSKSEPCFVGCRFENNRATYGGGLFANSTVSRFTACEFVRNTAYSSGGAVRNYDSSFEAVNCLFVENNATSPTGANAWGGALIHYGKTKACPAEFINCTFAANSARYGNGIVCDSDGGRFPGHVTLVSCILADSGPKVRKYDASTVTIRYCDVPGGSAKAVEPASGLDWGPGNISADPQFQRDGYRLMAGSPCIDSGDNAALPAGILTDCGGRPRIVDGGGDSRAIIDMGAYEYQ